MFLSYETFMMHVVLLCTINDFPGYSNLLGYIVKGHKACPICEENIVAHQLKHKSNTIYLCHRRVLRSNHPYQMLNKTFNGH